MVGIICLELKYSPLNNKVSSICNLAVYVLDIEQHLKSL